MIDVNIIFKQRIADIQSRIPVKLAVDNNSESNNFKTSLNQKVNALNTYSGSASAEQVLARLPYRLPAERKEVAEAALSVVNKVNYFWGGKSGAVGWDPKWGVSQAVTAGGSSSSNTVRPFGLDCSGFVAWAFHNAGKDISAIGQSTYEQNSKSTRIAWNDAQTGDLAFFNDLSHVGIVAGRDESDNLLVVHCSSGKNTVTIDKAKDAGFDFVSRPNLYSKTSDFASHSSAIIGRLN